MVIVQDSLLALLLYGKNFECSIFTLLSRIDICTPSTNCIITFIFRFHFSQFLSPFVKLRNSSHFQNLLDKINLPLC